MLDGGVNLVVGVDPLVVSRKAALKEGAEKVSAGVTSEHF
jgi:hypothetical protein